MKSLVICIAFSANFRVMTQKFALKGTFYNPKLLFACRSVFSPTV